ncbi:hypothetical protein OOK29_25870 [Streptomyces phaeochromogenes]|uniref:hypothetical protein n=1 Tax=Streptomyces phaeochromogenes TaxID=1923 RepID=UPI00225552CF|nr:hypothetical protein [Streptomyces phaeochromogenes]MCX5601582.1 hypothetical protein [Streptomyces phaeochromogenes]
MTSQNEQDEKTFRFARHATITVTIVIAALIAIIIGSIGGFKAFGRYQAVQDTQNKVKTSRISANNQVKLNEIQISTQQQRVEIEKQKAQIRYEKSRGIRESQDEIAKTLTPLYVQFEMTEALKEIAVSGRNNTVIYIPVGEDGLPMVADAAKQ